MIQLQALNHIIKNKDVDFLMLYSDDFYSNYKDEFNFILQHYNKYKTIPKATNILKITYITIKYIFIPF